MIKYSRQSMTPYVLTVLSAVGVAMLLHGCGSGASDQPMKNINNNFHNDQKNGGEEEERKKT